MPNSSNAFGKILSEISIVRPHKIQIYRPLYDRISTIRNPSVCPTNIKSVCANHNRLENQTIQFLRYRSSRWQRLARYLCTNWFPMKLLTDSPSSERLELRLGFRPPFGCFLCQTWNGLIELSDGWIVVGPFG